MADTASLARRGPGQWGLLEQDHGGTSFGRSLAAASGGGGGGGGGPHGVHRLSLVTLREDGGFAFRSLFVLNTDDCGFEVEETRAEGWLCNFKPSEGLKLQAEGSVLRKRCSKGSALQSSAWAALPCSSTCGWRSAAPRERPVPPPDIVLREVEAAFPGLNEADGWDADEAAGGSWEAVVPTALWARHVLVA